MRDDPARPGVLVWRNVLLPTSETFIVNQMTNMKRWSPFLAGVSRRPSHLPVEPQLVIGRLAGQVLERTGLSPALRRIAGSGRVRVAHAHFGPDAVTLLPVAAAARLPLLATFHGYDVTTARADLGPRYLARLQRLFDYSTSLIAVSDFIAGQLLDLGAPERKVVVHHIGVPVPAQRPLPSLERPSTILFVGRLVEKKNLGGLLHAVASLPGDLKHTPVRVIGNGPLEQESRARASGLGLDVTFLGAAPREAVQQEMRRATVFCSPGRPAGNGDAEGLPITPLEASAQGLPVVVGCSGGSEDAVRPGETGIVVDVDAPGDLSGALASLLSDRPAASAMGLAGYDFVRRHFNVEEQTAELESLYDAAASSTPR